MSWRLPFTLLVFGTIIVAVYVMYLTERNRTRSANYRRQDRFKPNWDRTRREDVASDPPEGESPNSPRARPTRRRIRIRR